MIVALLTIGRKDRMQKQFQTHALCAAILIASGCTEPTQPLAGRANVTASRGTSAYELSAAAQGRTERGVEDDILRMEAYVPGLGGAYYEEGQVVVYVPSTADPRRILAELAQASPLLLLESKQRRQLAIGQVRLRVGKYSFSQLIAWEDLLAPQLRHLHLVSSSDADERRNQIAIGIVDDHRASEVYAAAESLGIPKEAIVVEKRPFEHAMTTLRSKFDSSASGFQIANGNDGLCTLGWSVHRGPDSPDPDAEEGFYTASHCAVGEAGRGTQGYLYNPYTIYQRIAYITQNPAFDLVDAQCDTTICTSADAMYAKYDSVGLSAKRVAKIGTQAYINNTAGGVTITDYWSNLSGSPQTLLVNSSELDKVGRTTGWTRGTYAASCVKVNVHEPHPSTFFYTVTCADQVTGAASGQGDSGALVFQVDGNQVITGYGILFSSLSLDSVYTTNSEGYSYCSDQCRYSYSSLTRVSLHLPPPPF
jgi:hypothetical protein